MVKTRNKNTRLVNNHLGTSSDQEGSCVGCGEFCNTLLVILVREAKEMKD